MHWLTEFWWFDAVGFSQVFWTQLTWQALLWGVTVVIYAGFLWGNYQIAMQQTRDRPLRLFAEPEFAGAAEKLHKALAMVVILLMALAAALSSVSAWMPLLKFLNPSQFDDRDPIFHRDLGFYVFKLPFYEGIRQWLFALILLGLSLSLVVYGLKGTLIWERGGLAGRVKAHVSLLLSALALLIGWGFWLDRYSLLYAPGGVVFGAGYTDVHAHLLAYQVLSILALAVAVLFLLSIGQRQQQMPLGGIGLFIVALVLLNGVYPWLMQQLMVNPNELAKEAPYLEHNIRLTRAAYHLDNVQQQRYAATTQLDRRSLQSNQSTIGNIRLWDHHPLLSTYRQLQEIRLYYKFGSVDVDRYTLNGNYQQVMLSARELSIPQLPPEARTWVNQRLKYTHGYGLVMSPVTQVTADGLPELYIKDIPPNSQVDLQVSQPAIYYGEETHDYMFTGTSTDEFDYPLGETNAVTRYNGKGGVPLPSVWHRLAYAYDRNSLQTLISQYLTSRSRIHYYRQIQKRVQHVAPFLRFDSDPYLVVIQGKLQWLIDAYTVSDRYPYSQPVVQSREIEAILKNGTIGSVLSGNVNYIRNAVKVLVDAYDGTMQFFSVDEVDPILATYRRIFPQLFQPRAAIPAAVKAHFRYPQDLFKIQTQLYLTYHMSQPEVFYNREDLWRFPIQTYEGNQVTMQPYYVIMRLPGEATAGFILIQPFTPANKDNMIAWMAARSNGEAYGKLLLYEFPKQTLVYGPRQIEARIDQEPQISQQFTLWSQAGSKVIRGDLLVIPIEQSLLYVEPVYLRAEQGELPQLKRVIVVHNQAVVMEDSLAKSLAAIFGGEQIATPAPGPLPGQAATLARSALTTYRKAQQALRQGNWAEYGRYQQQLQQILEQLNQETAPR